MAKSGSKAVDDDGAEAPPSPSQDLKARRKKKNDAAAEDSPVQSSGWAEEAGKPSPKLEKKQRQKKDRDHVASSKIAAPGNLLLQSDALVLEGDKTKNRDKAGEDEVEEGKRKKKKNKKGSKASSENLDGEESALEGDKIKNQDKGGEDGAEGKNNKKKGSTASSEALGQEELALEVDQDKAGEDAAEGKRKKKDQEELALEVDQDKAGEDAAEGKRKKKKTEKKKGSMATLETPDQVESAGEGKEPKPKNKRSSKRGRDDDKAGKASDENAAEASDENAAVPEGKPKKKKPKMNSTTSGTQDQVKEGMESVKFQSKTLFVGNIPFHTRADEVMGFFAKNGCKALDCMIPYHNGCPRGFGYVEFSSADDAKKAMESLNKRDLMGQKVTLEFAYEDICSKRKTYMSGNWGVRRSVVVKGFDESVEEEQAILVLKDNDSFMKAQELDKSDLDGRRLHVSEAKLPVRGPCFLCVHCGGAGITCAKCGGPIGGRLTNMSQSSQKASTIVVKSLDRRLSQTQAEDCLRTHFSAYGSVARVSVPVMPGSNIIRRIGFVDFNDQEAATKAAACERPNVFGNMLRVELKR